MNEDNKSRHCSVTSKKHRFFSINTVATNFSVIYAHDNFDVIAANGPIPGFVVKRLNKDGYINT